MKASPGSANALPGDACIPRQYCQMPQDTKKAPNVRLVLSVVTRRGIEPLLLP